MAELETWQNVSRGRRGIKRIDSFGKTTTELVGPGRSVQLTRDERLYYQRNVATDDLDIFKNGALVPVQLIDEADQIEMASNPNLLGDSELEGLFKLHWKKFEAEIARITNVYALERLVEMAESSEDISVKKYNVVMARLEEVKEASSHTSKVTQVLAKGAGKVNF